MNACAIGNLSHFSTNCIDLSDEVPLGRTAYGWVARHSADRQGVHSNQGGGATDPGSNQGSLDPGMAAANNNDLVTFLPWYGMFHVEHALLANTKFGEYVIQDLFGSNLTRDTGE